MEFLPHVDKTGKTLGKISRIEAHGGGKWLHPVVHVQVFNAQGQILLQLRSPSKTIQPGKWDTAVGGHVDWGETPLEAALRETREEIGLDLKELPTPKVYLWESEIERELVYTYRIQAEGPFTPEEGQIQELRFLDYPLAEDFWEKCTPNLLYELFEFHTYLNTPVQQTH